MLSEPNSLDLIIRYFNDAENPTLKKQIQDFRAESAENNLYFLKIEQIWNNAAKAGRLNLVDIETSQKRFKNDIRKITPARIRPLSWILSAAAACLVIAMGYWFYALNNEEHLIVKTTKDQIDSVVLSDGSKIILASNTSISYPEKFKKDKRIISLNKGEAFFKVFRDEKHPFQVHMGASHIQVLGTSFNIGYSPVAINLTVKTGRVMFTPFNGAVSSILIAGQNINYDLNTKQLAAMLSQNGDAWITRELKFVDTPLKEVCRQLSTYYKIDFVLEDDKGVYEKFNASFNNISLNEVLVALKEAYRVKIKRENNRIIIKPH
ncbi:FecR family protein [Pedobacter nototheniae]|uniref:FecR family protein n=1 Tax=Pedobacter nototheniae TaxID=2488994 RepID=UPI00292D8238|nr:FecR domain-containing protein [Pedobacter nototheniae]